MATISLCMIVKNEERVLNRCLACIKNIVDEIIIIDTGSQDNTKQIAMQYTDKIYDYLWQDDFAAARNFSFSKATMDYQMWLDADDIINPESQKQLVALKQNLTADVVMLPYHIAFDEQENPIFTYYRERILKRSKNFRWSGAVHETITPSGEILYAEPAILHKKLYINDANRNLRILEKLLSENKTLSTRDKFYYANELFYHQEYQKAIQAYINFLKQPDAWIENKITACQNLAKCCLEFQQSEIALQVLLQTFLYDHPRAEICCDIGEIKIKQQHYEEAIFWYQSALHIPFSNENGGFSQPDCHDYIPYMQLCVCYDKLKNFSLAKSYNDKAGRIKPKDKSYLYNQKYFQEKLKSNTNLTRESDK
ncbi:MAG: glycosyltransferase family 2 protein [Oscillospiraceae bacterium]|nr:glycosyltransferase family 2 protein [Oscillospiraceae bacterium]